MKGLTGNWEQPKAALSLAKRFSDEAREALHNRDKAVVWARRYGATLRQIADATSLTPAGIAKIVKRNSEKVLDNQVDEKIR